MFCKMGNFKLFLILEFKLRLHFNHWPFSKRTICIKSLLKKDFQNFLYICSFGKTFLSLYPSTY